MKTSLKAALVLTVSVLGSLTLLGCSDPVFREAFYRGIAGAYYQRSQNPYVHPLGRASERFAAGWFDTLADAQRQQRLAQQGQAETYEEWRRRTCEEYGGCVHSPSERPAGSRASSQSVLRARAEIEQFLKADRENFRQWIDFLPGWIALLEKYGARETGSPHYLLSRNLHEDTLLLNGRADYYLANLPAYIHENMHVEKVRREIQDYLSKRESVNGMQKRWNDDFNYLLEETKKREEKIKRIETEQRRF